MHYVKLTDTQHQTIIDALRFDYKNAEQFGALPIGAALQEEARDAYRALTSERWLDEDDVKAIITTVLARCRPAMRVAIGDRSPKQYDRADEMATAIASAVRIALAEIGVFDPEQEAKANASTG